jgi:hypothetical protein
LTMLHISMRPMFGCVADCPADAMLDFSFP